ncbi:MAG: glycosyltransferase, partial [Kiritimatiellaeota bacterium]|nr:glycosyltransferase [Kiritimatiellota bacterium]
MKHVSIDDLRPPRPPADSAPIADSAPTIAVAVTAHPEYVERGWCTEAIRSVEVQVDPPDDKLLLLDGCKPPPDVPDGWHVKTLERSGSPTPARNLALELANADWITFLDADNVHEPAYIAAMRAAIARHSAGHDRIAVFYPDWLKIDAEGRPLRARRFPAWSLPGFLARNCIDIASCWRRDALQKAGGFHDIPNGDDFFAARRLFIEYGWRAQHVPSAVLRYREHADSRWKQHIDAFPEITWRLSRYLVVVMFSGGRRWPVASRMLDAFRRTHFPPHTHFL